MRRDENGYIVVETLLAFVLYLLTVLSVLTLINVAVVQSRVHYAITEACEAVSMYCYLLEATGAAGHIMNLEEKAQGAENKVQGVVDNMNQLINSARSLDMAGVRSGISEITPDMEDGDDIKNKLMDLFKGGLTLGTQRLEDFAFAKTMEALSLHYLNNGVDSMGKAAQTGREYLEAFQVDDMSGTGNYGFEIKDYNVSIEMGSDGSILLDHNGDVTVVVRYKVAYQFGALPLPFDGLEIRQVVRTKAWLNGEGKGYAAG